MESDTPRTHDEFSDAIKQLDLFAELAEMKKQRDEARGLYLQRNYHREQLERELAAAKAELVRNADELAAAIKQRDEARRWYCRLIAYQRQDRGEDFDPKAVAVEEGWDCFAQQEGGGA